jgi:hypothetical protein
MSSIFFVAVIVEKDTTDKRRVFSRGTAQKNRGGYKKPKTLSD